MCVRPTPGLSPCNRTRSPVSAALVVALKLSLAVAAVALAVAVHWASG